MLFGFLIDFELLFCIVLGCDYIRSVFARIQFAGVAIYSYRSDFIRVNTSGDGYSGSDDYA